MNMWNALREALRLSPPPSVLRNKAGGMAFIRFARDECDGSIVLHRRVVRTVSESKGFWIIDPPQRFVARMAMWTSSGAIAQPGDSVIVEGIHDDLLDPIREIGDDERDGSLLWLPPVPTRKEIPLVFSGATEVSDLRWFPGTE